MVRIDMKAGRSDSYREVRHAISRVEFRIAFGDFAVIFREFLRCLNIGPAPWEGILLRTQASQQFKGPTPVIRTHWVLSQE